MTAPTDKAPACTAPAPLLLLPVVEGVADPVAVPVEAPAVVVAVGVTPLMVGIGEVPPAW